LLATYFLSTLLLFQASITTLATPTEQEDGNDNHILLLEGYQAATPRIIGGVDATAGSYPFFASLLVGGAHSCGGSLIAPDVILTAAHCKGLTSAHVGRHNRLDPDDDFDGITIASEIRHPAYNDLTYNYDFMILKLEQPSDNPTMRINTDPDLPAVGVPDGVKVVGFGLTDYYYDGTHGESANILQEVDMEALTNEECMQSKDTSNGDEAMANGYEGLITGEMLCAQGDGEDSCLGDSGGPLMIQESGEYLQVGVVSWGYGCGDSEFPGVYSRISHQYEWIRMQVCDLSEDPPAYFDCDAPTLPPAQDMDLTVAITFDDFPDEITWELLDLYGLVVEEASIDTYIDTEASSTVYTTFTVKERGDYTFNIYDAGGDGLCCYTPGSFTVYIGTETLIGEILATGKGDFGQMATFEFTVPNLSDVTYVEGTLPPASGPAPDNDATTDGEEPTDIDAETDTETDDPNVPEATSEPTSAPTMAATDSPTTAPTQTFAPTSSPTLEPTTSPTNSPTISMAPTQAPTVFVPPKDTKKRNNIIFGVLIITLVGAVLVGTSWYADRQDRLSRAAYIEDDSVFKPVDNDDSTNEEDDDDGSDGFYR